MIRFVTGTDTGVGKTWVTAWLAYQAMQAGQTVAIYKPVQTGSPSLTQPEDPETVAQLLGGGVCHWPAIPASVQQPLAIGYTYNFLPPVTPAVADETGMIQVDKIVAIASALSKMADVLLIEGAGGILAPLTAESDIYGLIQRCYQAMPTLQCTVVARPDLGTINHTRLTLAALQGLRVDRVVVSGYTADSNAVAITSLPRMFEHWLPVPVTYLPLLPADVTRWPSDHWVGPHKALYQATV
jgi:dethiobiotin synthetase